MRGFTAHARAYMHSYNDDERYYYYIKN